MKNRWIAIILGTVLVSPGQFSYAESNESTSPQNGTSPMSQALASAYNTNSNLQAKLHEQFARHEAVNQAFSRFRPEVGLNGDVGRRHSRSRTPPPTLGPREQSLTTSPYKGSVEVKQNIYEGGGGLAALRAARHSVEAGRFDFINAEQTTLLNAASTYLNLIFRKAAVGFNEANVKFLNEQLRAAKAGLQVGDKTRTDVAEAESRLAEANAALVAAEGEVQNALANYKTVIGSEPNILAYPGGLTDLPTSRESVVDKALESRPAVQQALFGYEQAKANIDTQTAQLLPRLNASADLSRGYEQSRKGDRLTNYGANVSLTIPLYQTGSKWSAARQQAQAAAQARYQLEQARKEAREEAIKAWEAWNTAKKRVDRFKKQVEFATISRDGAALEADVGNRPYFDVLDAQRNLVQAQVELEGAKRDERLAEYQLYAVQGMLTAENLNLPVTLYDLQGHLEDVQYKLIGFGDNPLAKVSENNE